MARVLVTGGAGFIGQHVVQQLLDRGDEVTVIDAFVSQVHGESITPPSWSTDVDLVYGYAGDGDLLQQVLPHVDHVIHLAALVGVGQSMYEIGRYVRRNTSDTAVLLDEIARHLQIGRLVVASSMSIYGEGEYSCSAHGHVLLAPGPRSLVDLAAGRWDVYCPRCHEPLAPIPTRETKALLPTSVYAITKRDQEELCLVVGGAYEIPTVALRFFNVYGPGQALSNPYTGAAAIFASQVLNGNAPTIFEDGKQTRDFTHVNDIARAVILALDSEEAVGHAINVGTGKPTTVLELATTLVRHLGGERWPNILDTFRAGDIRHCYASTYLAERLLKFKAEIGLDEGMRELAVDLADRTAVDNTSEAYAALLKRGLLV